MSLKHDADNTLWLEQMVRAQAVRIEALTGERQMSDLVERLRQGVNGQLENYALRVEAADRIEALEAALRRMINDSMYKDHPEATRMARAVLEQEKAGE